MKTRSFGGFREPYVRGPHYRYFFISIMIAFLIAMAAVIGIASVFRFAYALG
jgi:hypothetical protein